MTSLFICLLKLGIHAWFPFSPSSLLLPSIQSICKPVCRFYIKTFWLHFSVTSQNTPSLTWTAAPLLVALFLHLFLYGFIIPLDKLSCFAFNIYCHYFHLKYFDDILPVLRRNGINQCMICIFLPVFKVILAFSSAVLGFLCHFFHMLFSPSETLFVQLFAHLAGFSALKSQMVPQRGLPWINT